MGKNSSKIMRFISGFLNLRDKVVMEIIEKENHNDVAKEKLKNLMEAKPSKLDDILQEKLEKAFHKETSTVSLHDLAKIACEHSSIDLAYAAYHLPPNYRPILYDNLPDIEAKVNFMINTDIDTRLKIFRYMSDMEMKELFEKMPTDEAVWILEDVSQRRFRRIMELIDYKKAHRIKEMKKHQRNSAGRLMTGEFFAFTMNMTIKEASLHIRDNPRIDFSMGIYIVNERKELQGYVPNRNLLINPSDFPLKQIMKPIRYKVLPAATREEVVDIVERYKISSLPVVDEAGKLLGVIAHEDVVEAMEDLADETIAKMAGTMEQNLVTDSMFKRFFARAPWLLVTLLAGLINVGIISFFDKQHGGLLTFVLFFVPLITGMSGNIGLQCSTILVRSMAIGMFPLSSRKESINKELFTGIFTGLIFGISCGIAVGFIDYFVGFSSGVGGLKLGIVVGVGLLGACFAATLLGVFSPIFFSNIGIDPAIASGPIVTAFNDMLSMMIYFLIAWGLGLVFFTS
jgi:magnesium transporter